MKMIAMTGYKGSGKNTVADFISRKTGFQQSSLAAPMKEVAGILFNWSADYIEKHKEDIDPVWGISPRKFLQVLGTDWFQSWLPLNFPMFAERNGKDFWCRHLLQRLQEEEAHYEDKNFTSLVTDLRFQHEELFFRRVCADFVLIFVDASGRIPSIDQHESEKQYLLLKPDYIISNNGTLVELEDQVNSILANLGVHYD